MPNMPSDDILDMLVADAILVADTTGFVNKEPSENNLKDGDPIAIVYDTGGFDPDATGKVLDMPTINVRVKGKPGDTVGAMALAQSIKTALHQRDPETINSARYMGIWQLGDIAFVEDDDRNRPILTANFRMHRTYA
jgi:hypothetical protein